MFKKLNILVLIGVLAAAFVFVAPASASSGDVDLNCRATWICAQTDGTAEEAPVVTGDTDDVQHCGYHRLYCIGSVPVGPTLGDLFAAPSPQLTTVYIN